jgi:hypothetical protein
MSAPGVAVFLVETSHHEGHCSGAECEYERYEETFEVESVADLEKIERGLRFDAIRAVLTRGSGYCKISDDPRARELVQHESRVTRLVDPFWTPLDERLKQ